MRRAILICAALLLVAPADAATRATRAHRQQHVLAAAFYQCLTMQRVACR